MSRSRKTALTRDDFLGGALTITQPGAGYRAGIDPVMLAAAIPAKPGDHVLELGVGVGVAALCLCHRVQNLRLTGLEINPEMAGLAVQNAKGSGLGDCVSVIEGDVLSPPRDILDQSFDHVMFNPPYEVSGTGTPPPDARRAQAHVGEAGTLEAWIDLAIRRTKPGGTITLVHKAEETGAILAVGQGRDVGKIILFPLWPRAGEAARRVLVQMTKGSKAPMTVSSGLVLHKETTKFTGEAEQILRHAAPLTLGG